jgi:hypothetical protein
MMRILRKSEGISYVGKPYLSPSLLLKNRGGYKTGATKLNDSDE